MSDNRRSPSAIADEIRERINLKELVGEYSYKRRLPYDSTPTFDIASRRLQEAGFLTKTELHEIALWKSPRSAGRVLPNSEQAVKKLTQAALTLASDPTLPVSVPIAVLTILEGVRVPMASVVLTAWDPKRFGIIDVNAWSAIFKLSKQHSRQFEPREYDEYMSILKKLQTLTRLTAREIDMALWEWWDQTKKRALR